MCNAWLAVALCLCARAPDFQVCYAAGQCRRDGAVGYGLVWRGIEVTLVLLEASSTPVRQSKGPARRVLLKPGVHSSGSSLQRTHESHESHESKPHTVHLYSPSGQLGVPCCFYHHCCSRHRRRHCCCCSRAHAVAPWHPDPDPAVHP